MLRKLLEITTNSEPDQANWDEVRTIAGKLSVLCRECRETLENSTNGRSKETKEETATLYAAPTSEAIAISSRNGSTPNLKGEGELT